MNKSIFLLSTIFAMTSCVSGSPEIQACLQGIEDTPHVRTIKNEKDGSEVYAFISVVFAFVDQNAILNVTTADFTAKNGETTYNAIHFVDSYGMGSNPTYYYYIVSTSTEKEIKVENGEQPGSLNITFDINVDSSYSFYYKNTKLVANEYIKI